MPRLNRTSVFRTIDSQVTSAPRMARETVREREVRNGSGTETASSANTAASPADLSRRDLFRQLGLAVAPLLTAALPSGCGYVVGSGYAAEVRTVHVPIFRSESFRRGVDFQLTEAVQKEIQRRTPFRLARAGEADTILAGRIVDVRQDVLGETRFDDPRELQLSLAVEVTWEDVRNSRMLARQQIALAPEFVQLVTLSEFAPEVGQSLATGTQQSVDRMARRIVDMMESPW